MCLNGNGVIFQTMVTITTLVRSQQNKRAVTTVSGGEASSHFWPQGAWVSYGK